MMAAIHESFKSCQQHELPTTLKVQQHNGSLGLHSLLGFFFLNRANCFHLQTSQEPTDRTAKKKGKRKTKVAAKDTNSDENRDDQ